MARPVFPYELDDPDFSWLLSRFREEHPEYAILDVVSLPLALIKIPEMAMPGFVPALPPPPGYDDGAAELDEGDL